jgi:hypothetical protein
MNERSMFRGEVAATLLAVSCMFSLQAAEDEYQVTPAWQAAMEKIAPEKAMAAPKKRSARFWSSR